MTKKQKDAHNKKVSRIIELATSSMETHLCYAYGTTYRKGESNAFHITCVEEYAEIISTASTLYRK